MTLIVGSLRRNIGSTVRPIFLAHCEQCARGQHGIRLRGRRKLQSPVSLRERLAVHSHAVVDGISIVLHATKSHEDAAIECEARSAVHGSEVADGGNPCGDNSMREGRVVR